MNLCLRKPVSEMSSTNLVRSENTLKLQGKVNFQTVGRLYANFKREMDTGIKRLDCTEIDEADSSAVSLLLACSNLAKRCNRDLEITGMGEQLLNLARLYGVNSLIENKL